MYIKYASQDLMIFEHLFLVDIISHIFYDVNAVLVISFHDNSALGGLCISLGPCGSHIPVALVLVNNSQYKCFYQLLH